MLTGLLLLSGLGLLFLGGEALVRGSAALALRFGLTPLFVGLTIVSSGTSSPELAVSISAAVSGEVGVAVGNVVGSNIANVGLILGLSALIRPISAKSKLVLLDVPIMIAGAFFVAALLEDGAMAWREGLLLLGGLLAYTGFGLHLARRESSEVQHEFEGIVPRLTATVPRQVLLILAGIVALLIGGRAFVDGGVRLAHAFQVNPAVIALTVVALGTSLPELVTSIIAAVRGHPDIAVGNAVGSNLFNLLGILGVASIVRPLGLGEVQAEDLAAMIAISILLLLLIRTRFDLNRWEGGVLIASYLAYLYWLFSRATGA
ncbi:MAG: calcium/sodium antiporter [Gemmatimonadota bacterium]|nr:MAG: calcium/sodium antiporter [Gemmatimonadota bacterium]